MKNRAGRRTEISVETHEIKIIRIPRGRNQIFCRRCGAQTFSFTPEQIAWLLGVSVAEIYCDIQAEKLHLTDPESDAAAVCGNSIQR